MWNPKDPNDIVDYELDWSDLLNGDTIASVDAVDISPVTSPPLAELVGSPAREVTATTTTIWLDGGVGGQVYLIDFTITTVGDRVYQRAVALSVQETIPATALPVLVTLAQAKDQIRVDGTDDDDDVYAKLVDAEEQVVAFIGDRFDATWTVATVPGAVRSAILLQVAHLWRHRGDSEYVPNVNDGGLAPGVRWLLQSNGYRDLTIG